MPPEMLKCQEQNGKNRSNATMSVFATSTRNTTMPLKCDKTNNGDGTRKPEEEDKYPCLRRALSCTETPILPLGTYAVEFGFDVSTLPFIPSPRTSSSTLFASSSERMSIRTSQQQPFQRILSQENHTRTTNMDSNSDNSLYSSANSSSSSSSSSYHTASCSYSSKTSSTTSLQRVTEDTSDTFVSRTSEQTQDNRHKFSLSLNSCTTNCHCFKPFEIGSRRSPLDIESSLTRKRSETSLLKTQDVEKKGQTDFEDVEATNEAKDEGESDGLESKELYLFCSRGLIAKNWKKDNRTWLWKSSGRKVNENHSDVERPVAKRWKKDERAWLWKTSKKDETEEEEEEERSEVKKEN